MESPRTIYIYNVIISGLYIWYNHVYIYIYMVDDIYGYMVDYYNHMVDYIYIWYNHEYNPPYGYRML